MRVLLPKFVRRSILPGDQLFATPGTERCLELHTSTSIRGMANLVADRGNRHPSAIVFGRLFYSQAEPLELDKQGRIRIPSRLANWASLKNQVAIVGVGSHWEIWEIGRWRQYFDEFQGEFDQIHRSTFLPVGNRAADIHQIERSDLKESGGTSAARFDRFVPQQDLEQLRKPK